jgi:hypothetical protein
LKKSHIQKGAIVIVVLLLFIGFIQYRDYKNTHFAVDKKTFNVKKSMDEIMKEVYKENPQLEGAFKYGVGVNLNKEVPIVSERREMKIEKAWLTVGMIYLTYSIDLHKEDKSLKNIPVLQAKKIIFHRDNGPDFTASIHLEDFGPPEKMKVTYNDRVYQSFIKAFQYDDLKFDGDYQNQIDNFKENYLNHVTSITLADPQMVKGKKKIALDNIKLPVDFNFDKYLVKTIPINKELQLGDNKVVMENYKKYFNHGELNYKASNGAMKNILTIAADVKVKGGSKTVNWETDQSIPKIFHLNDGKQFFPSIEAESMTITPTEYGYRDSSTIHFYVDRAKIKELQAQPDSKIKIADLKNGSLFFSIVNDHVFKGFSLIFKYDKTKYPHIGHMNWVTTAQIESLPDREQTLMEQQQQVIDIKDDKGHILSTFGGFGEEDSDGENTYKFNGGPVDWLDFSGLDITLHSLVYMNKITTEPITIELGK